MLPSRRLNVFLCHSSSDKATVRELYRQLSAEGWIDVWLDEMKLLPGQDWDLEIEKAVERADIFIACLSTHSVDKEGYVQKELRFVLNIADEKPEGSIFVIPLRLDECVVPRRLRTWHWVDYFPKSRRKLSYQRLLDSLKERAGRLGIAVRKSEAKVQEPAPTHHPYKQGLKAMSWRTLGWVVGGLLTIGLLFWGASKLLQGPPMDTPGATRTLPINVAFTSQLSSTDTSQAEQTSLPLQTEPPTMHTATSPSSSLGIGSTLTGTDGMTLLYVPPGEFNMGSNTGASEERPAHLVDLDPFWIDKTEVTVEMYLRCVSAGVCQDRDPFILSDYFRNSKFSNYPVMDVSWEDAKVYCEWADRRLPTEAEWERSARGEQGFVYPWGNDFGDGHVNFCDKNCSFPSANQSFDDGFAETAPIGSFPNGISPYGALDMAGNVAEWVADWYSETYYSISLSTNPLGPESGQKRVFRGGSWATPIDFGLRASYRSSSPPGVINLDIGFRCATSAVP